MLNKISLSCVCFQITVEPRDFQGLEAEERSEELSVCEECGRSDRRHLMLLCAACDSRWDLKTFAAQLQLSLIISTIICSTDAKGGCSRQIKSAKVTQRGTQKELSRDAFPKMGHRPLFIGSPIGRVHTYHTYQCNDVEINFPHPEYVILASGWGNWGDFCHSLSVDYMHDVRNENTRKRFFVFFLNLGFTKAIRNGNERP